MEPIPEPNKIVPLPTVVRLARDSVFEFLLTAVLLFGVVTIVRWVIGPSPISRAVPQIHIELVIVGAVVGLLLAGLILSPPGRASGGHTNLQLAWESWTDGGLQIRMPTRPPSFSALCLTIPAGHSGGVAGRRGEATDLVA